MMRRQGGTSGEMPPKAMKLIGGIIVLFLLLCSGVALAAQRDRERARPSALGLSGSRQWAVERPRRRALRVSASSLQ